MAKKRPYPMRGDVDIAHSLGALASLDLDLIGTAEQVENRSILLSLRATYTLRGITAGQTPIVYGISHHAYSAAQVEAWYENTGSWTEGDLANQEIANRKCRIIGVFNDDSVSTDQVLNDGKPITTKLNWVVSEGQGLNFWAYNESGAVLLTGAVVQVQGGVLIRPL